MKNVSRRDGKVPPRPGDFLKRGPPYSDSRQNDEKKRMKRWSGCCSRGDRRKRAFWLHVTVPNLHDARVTSIRDGDRSTLRTAGAQRSFCARPSAAPPWQRSRRRLTPHATTSLWSGPAMGRRRPLKCPAPRGNPSSILNLTPTAETPCRPSRPCPNRAPIQVPCPECWDPYWASTRTVAPAGPLFRDSATVVYRAMYPVHREPRRYLETRCLRVRLQDPHRPRRRHLRPPPEPHKEGHTRGLMRWFQAS